MISFLLWLRSWRKLIVGAIKDSWTLHKEGKNCFHHDYRSGESWIKSQIIDYRKLYWCTKCQRRWVR